MSDTTEITEDEREMWASTAAARINAVTPERQCEITAQERIVKALQAIEQAEARAEKAEKELAGADAEIAELRDELEDSRGTEKDAPNILCAIARLVGVYEHSQELGDDMGEMILDEVRDLIADKQTAEANVVRLTKERDWLAGRCAEELGFSEGLFKERKATANEWKEAARRAVAAGEE